jgi:hypothetical protein
MRKNRKSLKSAEFQKLYNALWESCTKPKSKVSATFLRETTRIPNQKEQEGEKNE